MTQPLFTLLTIAGSDSGGGAGIQADLKTVTALGGYGTSAITALTAQNTSGVSQIMSVTPQFLEAQITAILSDIHIDVIKLGMLFDEELIQVVAEKLPSQIPIILDPVMIAKGGAALLVPEAITALKEKLFPKAYIVTPNLPELKALTGGDTIEHARTLITQYQCPYVLIKGGHNNTPQATDILVTSKTHYTHSLERIKTHAGHGTGCTLSSAIACYLGMGHAIKDAVRLGKLYVHEALTHAPRIGKGCAPLLHNYKIIID